MIVLVSKGYFEELTAFADAIVDRSANLTATVSRYYIHQVAANAWMYFEFALYYFDWQFWHTPAVDPLMST